MITPIVLCFGPYLLHEEAVTRKAVYTSTRRVWRRCHWRQIKTLHIADTHCPHTLLFFFKSGNTTLYYMLSWLSHAMQQLQVKVSGIIYYGLIALKDSCKIQANSFTKALLSQVVQLFMLCGWRKAVVYDVSSSNPAANWKYRPQPTSLPQSRRHAT